MKKGAKILHFLYPVTLAPAVVDPAHAIGIRSKVRPTAI